MTFSKYFKLTRSLFTLLFLVPVLLATPTKAFGYVDPGSGSYVFQAIYAAFIGGAFYFRKAIWRVFGRRK